MTISLDQLLEKSIFLEKLGHNQKFYLERDPDDNVIDYMSIPTGFVDFDKICGLKKYGVNVIASRPAMGKTSLALNMALNIALSKKLKNLDRIGTIHYLNFESSYENILIRLIVNGAKVERDKITTGSLNDHEFQRVIEAVENLKKIDFKILDEILRNEESVIDFIEAKCRDDDIVFIDYLDLIINNIRSEPYTSGVDFVRHLKTLAINRKITFVILSQLTKKVEDRQGHRPMISDLPYGVLTNHSDAITLLLRREHYDPLDRPGMAELIIAKNRHGSAGFVNLTFEREFVCFKDYTPFKYDSTLQMDEETEKEFAHFSPD